MQVIKWNWVQPNSTNSEHRPLIGRTIWKLDWNFDCQMESLETILKHSSTGQHATFQKSDLSAGIQISTVHCTANLGPFFRIFFQRLVSTWVRNTNLPFHNFSVKELLCFNGWVQNDTGLRHAQSTNYQVNIADVFDHLISSPWVLLNLGVLQIWRHANLNFFDSPPPSVTHSHVQCTMPYVLMSHNRKPPPLIAWRHLC